MEFKLDNRMLHLKDNLELYTSVQTKIEDRLTKWKKYFNDDFNEELTKISNKYLVESQYNPNSKIETMRAIFYQEGYENGIDINTLVSNEIKEYISMCKGNYSASNAKILSVKYIEKIRDPYAIVEVSFIPEEKQIAVQVASSIIHRLKDIINNRLY